MSFAMTKQSIPPAAGAVIISLDDYRSRRNSVADRDAAFERLDTLSARVWSRLSPETHDRNADDALTRCEDMARTILEDLRYLVAQRSNAW